jgi:hypothetical protein
MNMYINGNSEDPHVCFLRNNKVYMQKDAGAGVNIDPHLSQYTAQYALIFIYFPNQSHHREEQKDSGEPRLTWPLVQYGT